MDLAIFLLSYFTVYWKGQIPIIEGRQVAIFTHNNLVSDYFLEEWTIELYASQSIGSEGYEQFTIYDYGNYEYEDGG